MCSLIKVSHTLYKFVYVLCCFREHKQFLRSDFQFLSLKFAWQDTYIRKPHKATCTEIGWQQHFSKFQRKQQLLVWLGCPISFRFQVSSLQHLTAAAAKRNHLVFSHTDTLSCHQVLSVKLKKLQKWTYKISASVLKIKWSTYNQIKIP